MLPKLSKLSLSLLTLLLLFSACKRELKPSWDVDYYGPIGETRITLAKLVPDDGLEVGADSLLTLIYEDTLFSLELDTLVKMNDTLSSSKMDVPFALNLPPGQKLLDLTSETKMEIGEALFTSAHTIDARIRIETESTSKEDLLIKYTIPSATRNGLAFSAETTIPATDSVVYFVDYLDLQGYTFDFTGQSGVEVNTMISKTEIWVHPDADTVSIQPGDKIYVHTFLENLTLGYARGYFGSGDYHIQEQSNFGLFENIPSGMIKMDSIRGHISIRNSVGMDARVQLNDLTARNQGTSLSLIQDIVGKVINVSRAIDDWGNITSFERTIDLSNNNLQDIIQMRPEEISYDLLFQMNPLGNTSMGNDFIYHGKGMDILLNLQTPLNVTLDDVLWCDTMELNIDEFKGVQSGRLILETKNMFPFKLKVNMYLLDGTQIIDSLAEQAIIVNEALLDASYHAVSSTVETNEIKIDDHKLENFHDANRILVQVTIANPDNQQSYPLRSDQFMDVVLKGDFVYRINEKEAGQ